MRLVQVTQVNQANQLLLSQDDVRNLFSITCLIISKIYAYCSCFCTLLVAPKIDRKNLRNLTVREGEPIYIDVKISGEPAPDVTWLVNDKILTSVAHRRVDNVPYNSKLFNDSPERKDSGTYKITATNKYGTDTAEIDINVTSKLY